MFGAQARARTTQTAGQVWNGSKDLGAQAWNGAKTWGNQALDGFDNLMGVGNHSPWQPAYAGGGVPSASRPMTTPTKQQPLMMQGNNPEGAQGAGTPETPSSQSLQSKAPTTPNLPELKDIKLGKELGKGGNKTAYEVPGREDLAIAVLKQGKSAASIDEEIGFLNTLKEQGLPTTEVMGTTTHNGQPAVVMKKYAQGSKDVVKMVNGKATRVGDSMLLNERSIQDLNGIKETMKLKKVKIDDLQFLIGKDGSVVIADPLDVSVGTKLPSKNNNFKMIDKLIDAAKDNIDSK